MSRQRHHRHMLRSILRVVLWTLMAVVLFILGTTICLVRVLKPETLTPMLTRFANNELDADVEIGSVDLTFRGGFPFVNIDIDTLVITSRQIKALDAGQRAQLPQWADTLLSIDHMHGGINIAEALAGRIDISDVDIVRPQLSICVADQADNYSVFRADRTHSDSIQFPSIRLRRFRFVDPQPVRYADVVNDVHVVARLSTFDIKDTGDTRRGIPRYSVQFESNVHYPLLQRLGMGADMPVSVDGTLEWDTRHGSVLVLSDFDYTVGRLSGKIDSEFDFHDRFTLNSLDFTLNPVAVDWALRLLPDTTAARLSIPRDIDTDARLGLSLTVHRPFTIGQELLPHATLHIDMPDCRVRWRDLVIDHLALDAEVQLHGLNINAATMRLAHLDVQSAAGDLHLSGTLSNLLSDPGFSGRVRGSIDIDKLPGVCASLIPASLSGTVTTDVSVRAKASMLTPDRYLDIRADGGVDVRDFTYLADDTLKMYHIDRLAMRLGRRAADGGTDSTLCADIDIGHAEMLASNIAFNYRNVSLKADTRRPAPGDKGVPVQGRLHVSFFDMATLGSGSGMSVRKLDGRVAMPAPAPGEWPRFDLDLQAAAISAGGARTRLELGRCHLQAAACGLRPAPPIPEEYMHKRAMAKTFGIKRASPQIPLDSIYILALEVHDEHHRRGHHRVHPAFDSQGQEYIDFGATRTAWALLNAWDVRGRLTAATGRLESPSVTLPNSVGNFNFDFSTDSATLTNVAYRIGHSDFLLSGVVSNMRKGFTSPDGREHLRLHFEVLSDTVDIDQLADPDPGRALAQKDEKEAADTMPREAHPLLLPANIDVELDMRAANLVYSSLVMHSFSGTLLMCDGTLSLHQLQAASDVGSVELSGVYSAPSPSAIKAGVGLKVSRFDIADFLRLVPALDSLMPMLGQLGGVIDADMAATTRIRPDMDLEVPSLRLALTLKGDSLRLLDPEAYRDIGRWLMLRRDDGDVIPHVTAQLTLRNGHLDLYPFIFDFNRYRLGVQGQYDIDSTFSYHVAVLHSPIPFRFGINIDGRPHHMKVRFGGPRICEADAVSRRDISPNARISLLRQFDDIFRRGVADSRFIPLQIDSVAGIADTPPVPLAEKDSLYLVNNQKNISYEENPAPRRAD